MSETTEATEDRGPHEIVCPHCKKTFTAELIAGGAERYRGYKCPHCKLFVPAERVSDTKVSDTS